MGLKTHFLLQLQDDLVFAGLSQLNLALKLSNFFLELASSRDQVIDLDVTVLNDTL